MDNISKILGLHQAWVPPKSYTELENLAGIGRQIAARHEKINGLSGLLFSKQAPGFLPPSQDWMKSMLGIATQTNKLHQTLLRTVQNTPLYKMNTQLMGLDRIVAVRTIPRISQQFTVSMHAIAGNTSKMHSALQKIINQNPFIQLSREFKGYEKLAITLKNTALESLPQLIVDELYQQTEKAAVLAENFAEPNKEISQQVVLFREFVDESFAKITESIQKTARSPKAEIDFWAGILSLLITILVLVLQPSPATESQMNDIGQKVEKVSEDVSEMRRILEKKVYDTLSEFSETRTVIRPIYLRLSPKINSFSTQKLEVGEEVNVIVIKHKWAYITFMDDENLPINGWVLKKYLVR